MASDHELETFLPSKIGYDDTATMASLESKPVKVQVEFFTLKRNYSWFRPSDLFEAVFAVSPDATVHEIAMYAIEKYPETAKSPDFTNMVVFQKPKSIVDMAAKYGDVFGPEDVMVISNNLRIHEIVKSCENKLAFATVALLFGSFMFVTLIAYLMSH